MGLASIFIDINDINNELLISINDLLISMKMVRASIFIDINNYIIDINKDGRRLHIY